MDRRTFISLSSLLGVSFMLGCEKQSDSTGGSGIPVIPKKKWAGWKAGQFQVHFICRGFGSKYCLSFKSYYIIFLRRGEVFFCKTSSMSITNIYLISLILLKTVNQFYLFFKMIINFFFHILYKTIDITH